MKQLLMICLLTAGTALSFGQAPDLRRKIDVTGSAEMEVTPDIIYIGVSLKEYYTGNRKSAGIDELEKSLQQAVSKAGIPKENLTVNNISSYNYDWEKKKNPNFTARKQFRLKVSDPSRFNAVLAALDPKAVEYTNIEGYEHSRITEFRKDLKIKALQAARQKALYLSEAFGDGLGDALDIQEINNDEGPGNPVFSNAIYRSKTEDAGESAPPDVEFRKIKLHYQMRAVFELKK